MDIDPLDSATADESATPDPFHLGTRVAITVALLASFMGVCTVKDDNIVQAMQQAQADKIDQWSFYQARNIREAVATASATQLRLAAAAAPASLQPEYQKQIKSADSLAADQASKKEELRLAALQSDSTYAHLNYRDDQFDLSDTLIALAISMLAMTALTRKRWLFWVSLVPTLLGVLMGLAGLLGWHLRPDFIVRLLS